MSRTIIVSGATRGIGRAIVEALLRQAPAARVVMLARDRERAEAVRAALQATTGRRPELVLGDLGSLAGARALTASIADAYACIDVLVHNAGLWPTRRELSPEGIERAFVTNHLAPFVVTAGLRDRIPRGGRVVQVTAGLYPLGRLDARDLERTARGDDFSRIRTYASTKLANLLATRGWAERLAPAGIDVNAVHPGVIRTHLGASRGPFGWLLAAAKLMWKSPAHGARGPVRLALDLSLSGTSDRFYNELDAEPWRAPATDSALALAVWAHAESRTGVAFGAPP